MMTQWMLRAGKTAKVALWAAMLATVHGVMAMDYGTYRERGYADSYYMLEGLEGVENMDELEGLANPPGMNSMNGMNGMNSMNGMTETQVYIERDDTERDVEREIESNEREEDEGGQGQLYATKRRKGMRKAVDPMDCEMPCRLPCRFDAHFTALALRPCGGAFDYVVQTFSSVDSPSWEVFNIKPNYHFAFELGANIQPDCMCGCFMINWEHLHSKDTSSHNLAVNSDDFLGPLYHINPHTSFTRSSGRLKFHFDEVDVDYGVFLSSNACLDANFYSGVSFVHIQRDLTTRFASRDQANRDQEIVRLLKSPSTFDGIGPQIGVDLTYRVCDGLCITGGGATGLLFGRMKNHTHFEAESPALANTNINIRPPNRQSLKVHHSRQLIPAFEGRLGIGYCADRLDCSFRFEIGYFAQVFINAIQSVDVSSTVINSTLSSSGIGTFPRTFERHFSNFALAGPYVTLGIRF